MPAPRNETSSITFFAASSSRWRLSSASERAGGTSSTRPKRTAAGMSRKSSSTDATPIAASIASRSSGVRERKLTPGLVERLAVARDVEQRARLGRLGEAHADQPAGAVGVLVHGLGRIEHELVHLEYL